MANKGFPHWFEAHPAARAHALRRRRRGASAATILAELRARFACPFRDRVSLHQWLRRAPADRGPPPPTKPRAKRAARPAPERFLRTARDVRALERRADLFVTCAVNNAPVCADALRALERAADECGGAVVINPIRYRNPTSRPMHARDTGQDGAEWWDPAVRPHLLENELTPHPLLSIMTTKAAATAANPLPARVSSRTKDRSAVFGHPQLAMRTVATPQHRLPKILYSSGAVTERAYSDTLAGDMASFHHSVAAVKVEVRGDRFHLREIAWDGERFVDLDREYRADGQRDAARPEALVLGDVHVGLEDAEVDAAVFGAGGLVPALAPRRLVLHDLFDGRAVNPHERGNALLRAARAGATLEAELAANEAWLAAALARAPGLEAVLVPFANHHQFLDRWLQGGAPEPADAELFHWLSWRLLAERRATGAFPLALETALRRSALDPRVRFLRADESYQVGGVELGMHGHLGPNGARGSPLNLSRIGTRFIAGHVHSPEIFQGGYWAGLLARLQHGYNLGPSGWLHTQVLLHANHARQMVHVVDGRWRG
jgi:hypothetical protein